MITKFHLRILIIFFILSRSKLAAQNNKDYVDSIDHYQNEVDSTVTVFYIIPPSNIGRSIIHYRCIGREGGSYAELYFYPKEQVTLLTWQSNCDSVFKDKAWYFINSKIVLAMDGEMSKEKRKRKYYKDGILVFENGVFIDTPIPGDKDLTKGYQVLKDFSRP